MTSDHSTGWRRIALIEQGWIKDEYRDKLKHLLIHSIRSDEAVCGLTVASKFNTDWAFLRDLRDLGRKATAQWLEGAYDHIGHHSTVDVRSEYLGAPAVHTPHVHA